MLGGLFIDGGQLVADAHRYKVGDIEVTVLSDGFRMVPVDDKYLATPAPTISPRRSPPPASRPTRMKNTYSPIVLTIGGKRVLFDTGNGEAASARARASAARSTPILPPPASTATPSTWW